MKAMKNYAILLLAGMFVFTSCDKDNDMPEMTPKNIVEVAQSAGQFSILIQAVQKAGLADFLGNESNLTVFAPTDDAFAQLLNNLGLASLDQIDDVTLTSILKYHVLSSSVYSGSLKSGVVSSLNTDSPDKTAISLMVKVGGDVMINDSKVTKADIAASNGVIHVIDRVLLPPTIVDLATFNDDFSTLVSAVLKADLAGTLNGTGPFTVFAPTNVAFGSLLSGLGLSSLEDVPVETLTGILTYHVVGDNVRSSELSNGMVQTVSGKSVNLTVGNTVVINGKVNVIIADIQGTNGIIHVIDQVLVP